MPEKTSRASIDAAVEHVRFDAIGEAIEIMETAIKKLHALREQVDPRRARLSEDGVLAVVEPYDRR